LKRATLTAAFLGLGLGRGVTSFAQDLGSSLLVDPDELSERLIPALSRCPSALRLLQSDFRLVDVRPEEDYLGAHSLTAVHFDQQETMTERAGVPGLVPLPEAVEELFGVAGLDPTLETVLYSDEGNLWATRLFWMLEYYGHTNARILDGGFARWARDESMLEEGEPKVTPDAAHFRAEPDPSKIVDAAWIEEHLGDPNVVFIDARPVESYNRGHLPGALALPWRENIDWGTESFKPTGQLLTRFAGAGATPGKTVVSYCQLGVLSAHNYFVLRLLGYPDVRLYDGSWADWKSVEGRPVEQSG
jgi:thiosulfate/3-mercaptopyruvate sulfurtransferase